MTMRRSRVDAESSHPAERVVVAGEGAEAPGGEVPGGEDEVAGRVATLSIALTDDDQVTFHASTAKEYIVSGFSPLTLYVRTSPTERRCAHCNGAVEMRTV